MMELQYFLLGEIAVLAIVLRIVSMFAVSKCELFAKVKRESIMIVVTIVVWLSVCWGWYALHGGYSQRPAIGFPSMITPQIVIFNLLKATVITAFAVLTYMSLRNNMVDKWKLKAILTDIRIFVRLMLKPVSVVLFVIALYLCTTNIIH